jgi:branched-chain amino acid transport system ATP-binding protein
MHISPAGTTSPAPEVVLETIDASVRFGGVVALDSVTMHVRRGEVCGLIGPNGAGKTTLFDVLSGVRPPNSGRVLLDGQDVTRRSATWRARHGVRRTFQRQQIFGGLSLEDNVVTALEWRGGGGGFVADMLALPSRRRRERERREQARATLAELRIDSRADELAGAAPIGVARELEVARAVVDRESLSALLLDEPTSGLAERERDRLGDVIDDERARGTAVVLVEHDVEFVMQHCDRIVVLNLGRVIATGTPAEIRAHPEVLAAYLS